MSITATSTLVQVFAANIAVPSTKDLAAWTTISPLTAGGNVATKVGLFGIDLTDFLADCAMASAVCTEKDFKKFSGWAIGV